MRLVGRLALIVAATVVGVAALLALLLAIPATRSSLLTLALRVVVWQRGYHYARGSVSFANRTLSISDLVVDDDLGETFLTAKSLVVGIDPAGLFGRSDRQFGLRSLELFGPRIELRRRADGTWNFQRLLPQGGGVATPAPAPAQPLRAHLRIVEGQIDVMDPQAVVAVGKAIAITQIESVISLDKTTTSFGGLSATLRTGRGNVGVRASFFEDDRVAFARATLQADALPMAPVFDAFVPAHAFIVEGGVASLRMQAFSLGYSANVAQQWHVTGDAAVRSARIHVTPLVVPIRDVHCHLHFQDGLLSIADARGQAAGMPLFAQGAVQLFGGTRLWIAARQAGRLEQAKAMLSFAQKQDLAGPFSLGVRVDGPLADLHVDGTVRSEGARYATATLPLVRGTFHYSQQHVTVSALDLSSGGAKVWSQADFNVGSKQVDTLGLIAALAPAREIPVVANLIPEGMVKGVAALGGPIAHLSGDGYAQVTAPSGNLIRTFFGGGPQAVVLGPLLYQVGGSEGFAWAQRAIGPASSWTGALVASHLPLAIRGGRTWLADVAGPSVALPSLDTTLDGEAFILENASSPTRPNIAIDARASNLVYQGVSLGTAQLQGAGSANRVRIGRASLAGPAATVWARGEVGFDRGFAPQSAILAGRATADLSAFATAFPSLHPRGTTAGNFSAVYDQRNWIGGAQLHSPDASIANVPLRSSTAFVDESGGTTSLLADILVPGGGVWAFGTLARQSGAGDQAGSVNAVIPRLDLSELEPLGLRGARGTAAGFATIGGSSAAPVVMAAAALRGSYNAIPYNGDLDVRYALGTLRSNGSRIALEGNQATINGSVSGMSSGSVASRATLALDVRVREGDLVALDRFTGKNAPITGSYDADARVGGALSQPAVDARIDTEIGTIRGVAFNGLHGAMRVRPGSVALSGGTVALGTSIFGLNADSSAQGFSVAAKSPHVDMSDFNDFFGGADVFAGTGSFDVRVASRGHRLAASGDALLDDAALRDYRLGHIQTTFSSTRRGGLHAIVNQNGPGGSMRLAGTVGFRSYRAGLPDFATARYRVRAHLRNLAVDEALPLIHQENLGLTGLLDADGTMRGSLHKPTGTAIFTLHDGYLRRIAIEQFSAKVAADDNGIQLSGVALQLPFLTAQGSGGIAFAGRRINGRATLQAAHLGKLGSSLRVPGSLRGEATGQITLSGSLDHPRALAEVDAKNGSYYGVVFDELALHAQYAPGEVSIGDTSLTFAGKGGRVSVRGTLPVQLRPLALGPKERPVNFAMSIEGMDLSVLDPLTNRFATLSGKLNADASVIGSAGNPVGKGTARISGASVHSPLQTVPVTDASADVSFENDTISLKHLHGTVGPGSIDVQGAAHIVPALGLRSYAGLQLSSRISFHNAQVNVPNWLSGNIDGQLSFTRTGPTPYLAGTVGLSNSVIPFSAIYALAEGGAVQAPAQSQAPGVPPLRPGHTIVYGGGAWGQQGHMLTTIGAPTPAPTGFSLPSIDLSVGLNANNNVRIRGGSSIDLTTTGGIIIAGNLQAPTLNGQFQAIRGQVGYFDTTFRLISGTVTFDPTSGLLPTLNATAVTNVSGAQITLTVSGRVDNLNTDLESNPSMSRDEIIATLLHAPTVAALTGSNPGQAQATLVQTAQSFFNAQLSRSLLYPVESALAQELNIESISLIFNQYGDLAVEVRTRFSPSVSAVYQSSVSVPVTTAYGMSYRLQDYLALDVLQTSRPDYALYSTVFNLRYTFR